MPKNAKVFFIYFMESYINIGLQEFFTNSLGSLENNFESKIYEKSLAFNGNCKEMFVA